MAKAQNEVATQDQNTGAIATIDNDMFAADAGQGMEGAGSESFAIPFLSVLQKGSPQVDETSGVAIEGARQGMFFENVGERMFDGKKGVLVVPCTYRRVFIRWGNKDMGGGFKGELLPEEVVEMRARGQIKELDNRLYVAEADGTVNEKKSDLIKDTRNHFVLLMDEETGSWQSALLSLSSTQIKKSKMLMSALAGVKIKGPSGLFTPPTFANVVRCTTVAESNDKGSWFGIKFAIEKRVDRADVYQAAKDFHASVIKGAVVAKYEDAEAGAASEMPEGF